MFDRQIGAAWCCRLQAALWLCLAVVLVGVVPPVKAANPWHVQEAVQSFKYSYTYVLWVKSGTTDTSGNYTGDTASIWTVDATGHQMAVSPTYGPYAGWHADQLAPVFNGTLRMAWTKSTGTTFDTERNVLSFWVLDASANRMYVSSTYGPYAGWHYVEFFTNPDGTSNLYWAKYSYDSSHVINGDSLSIWTVDAVGSQLTISPTYGPYPGWFGDGGIPSFNQDGTNFVTWINQGTYDTSGNYSGDQISIWKTDSRGNQTSIGPTYGRYPGWHFGELYPAYDGTARLLWTLNGTTDNNGNYSGDTASVWSVDATGHQRVVSPTYGPFAGWNADSIVAAPSSTSRLLWILPGSTDTNGNDTGDQGSIWSLNASNVKTAISPTYFSAGGTLDGLMVFADGSERLGWKYGSNTASNYQDTQGSLWALDASSNLIVKGPVYGPYP